MCATTLELQCVDTETGEGLLHLAAKRENRALCELLLSKGADPRAVDRGGHTPLHAACAGDTDDGALGVVTCLLAAGVPRRAASHAGATAAELARCRGHHLTLVVFIDQFTGT